MKNSFLNKFLLSTILTLTLVGFACSNDNKNEIEPNGLEYLGYEYIEGQVKIYLKNYNADNYLVTLNSLAPQDVVFEKGIYELFFLNKEDKNSSLKIKNNLNIEENLISKSLLNPKLNYKEIPLNENFNLKINETGYEELTKTTIRLINISEDSRCPNPTDNNSSLSSAGSCIHKPKTLLHIFIETPKNKTFDEFIYKDQLADYEFFYGGNYIKVLNIEPDILELNRLIPDSEYEVTFSINKN